MKKTCRFMLVLLLVLLTVSGCKKQTEPDDEEKYEWLNFEDRAVIAIEKGVEYKQLEREGFLYSLDMGTMAIFINFETRETLDAAGFDPEIHLKDYAELLASMNQFDTTIEEAGDHYNLHYDSTADNLKLTTQVSLYERENGFWLVNYIYLSEQASHYKPLVLELAKLNELK